MAVGSTDDSEFRRWSREYLTSLRGNLKWKVAKPNIAIDNIVLIIDKNALPLSWRMSKVIETHSGKNNKVRVVTLKTANGTCKRAISNLCKFPTADC